MSTSPLTTVDWDSSTWEDSTVDPHLKYIIELGSIINFYCTPPIIAFGFFGNICTFIIMSRPGFNKNSSSIYFRTLAVMDFIALFNHISYNWVEDHFERRYHYWWASDLLCKLCYAKFGWAASSSAMILVALTFERFLITAKPLKSKTYCTRRNAKIVCTIITGGLGIIWFSALFSIDPRLGVCFRTKTANFMQTYGKWMYAVLYTYIPTPAIFILNFFLVYRLIQARRQRLKMTETTMTSHESYPQFQRLTMMAVMVSVVYFILTLPTSTLNILGNWSDPSVMTPFSAWIKFLHHVSLVIRASNHAVNFILYLLVNNRIRAEFISMMKCNMSCARCFNKIRRPDETEDMATVTSVSTLSDNGNNVRF